MEKLIIHMKYHILKILNKRSEDIYHQFIRYFISSLIALAFDYVIYFFLTRFINVHYVLANIISRSFGIVVNYIINIIWVFDKKRFNRNVVQKIISFFIFVSIGFLSIGINTFFIWLFTDILKIFDMVSKIFSTFLSYIFNFGVRKTILFTKKDN